MHMLAVWDNVIKSQHFESDCHQAHSQGVGGGCNALTHIPNLPKSGLSATKWTKNEVFVGGLRRMRFKESTFYVQKVQFWGIPHLQN